jgi:hypothetical protein
MMNVVEDDTVESVVEYFSKGEIPKKSELLARLKKVVGRTKRGQFVVKTVRGVITMSRIKLHDYLGNMWLSYVDDDVVTQNAADFTEKVKKKLHLLKPT